MTIEKGSSWGSAGKLPPDGVVCSTDAEMAAVVTAARRAGHAPPVIGLVGGDLWRTMGAPNGGADRLISDQARSYPVDLGSALADGRQLWFVAHLVVHHTWLRGWQWRGPLWGAFNAEWLGRWDVAPRGHPNDGRLEIVEADLSFLDRMKARRRLPTGSHLPHPGIRIRPRPADQARFGSGQCLHADGIAVGPVTDLVVRVEPDALTVVV